MSENIESNFKNDTEQEAILTPIFYEMFFKNYFEKEYYRGQKTKSTLIDFKNNSAAQYDGVDVLFEYFREDKTIPFNVDIKCQTNKYINHPTNTFSIEISYLKNDVLKEGWFVKNGNKTNYYLFVWIHSSTFENMITDISQLEEVEFMLVRKKDIQNLFLTEKFNRTNLIKQSQHMRENNIERTGKRSGFHFTLSKKIKEQPVNVIVPKSIYKKLPNTLHFWYSNGNMRRL